MVNVHPSPVADFGYVPTCQSDSVYFSDSSSVAPGTISSWSWSFGDGSTASVPNPVHSYTASGTYTVTLVVTSDSGCTATYVDTVVPGKPIFAGFTGNKGCSANPLLFADTSVVINGSITAWSWNFTGGNPSAATTSTASVTYAPGTHTVTLIVTSSSGCTDTVTNTVTINTSPVASYSVLTTCALDSVYFTSTSVLGAGNIISWSWSFGDTNTSSAQNPVHYYDSAGAYVVALTVLSDSGCSATFTDTVSPAKAVIAGFSFTADCDFNVLFSDTTHLASGDSILSWSWDFGDGSAFNTTQNPTHTYADTGTYIVVLHIATLGGCSDSIADTLVMMPPPFADFTPAGGTYNAGETVAFTDLSTNAVSWIWTFGDGTSDTIKNPSHTYDLNGTLNVMLVVTNSNGCPDTAQYTFIFNTSVVAVPSAFTPNGDGQNDQLFVKGGPLKEMDWRIYNEWGNEVFHATSQSEGWDGKYRGKIQPQSRYVFILKGTTFGNDVIELNGDVTILR